jgi:RNA polymerase sigma factor (sigma-70 family)
MSGTEFWDVKYRENAPALLAAIRRYVPDGDLAQDLMHEAFVTAINKYDSYSNRGSFDGWLHRIAINTALMHLRNNKDRFTSAEVLNTVADEEACQAPEGNDDMRFVIETAGFSAEELLSAADCLPVHHRMVFNMYVMDNFSHKQIAAKLHISPGTSKSHLARARKKIQQYLYENALDKKRKTNRKRAALLLLFPAKTHFIDKLYRKKLADFKIPPDTSGFLPGTLEETVVQSGISFAGGTGMTARTVSAMAFRGSKLSYAVTCCGTAAVTAGVCFTVLDGQADLSKNQPVTTDSVVNLLPAEQERGLSEKLYLETETDSLITDTVQERASLKNGRSAGKQEEKQTNPVKQQKPEPVVVKRKIIEKKTVVVRDTVVIRE